MSKETHFWEVLMASFELPLRMGARVALIGMGKTNLGILDFLGKIRPDLCITVRDKSPCALPLELPFFHPVEKRSGSAYLDRLDEDILFLSPTVRVDSKPIQDALRRGISVSSDVSFFSERTQSTCFGVTGSDGKSTTVSLGDAILRESGVVSRLGGNIGRVLMPFLAVEQSSDITVLELSSFQLQLPPKHMERALITNLTPNHLDFHLSLEEYYNVKCSLLFAAKKPIVNMDDAEIARRCATVSPYVCYSMADRYDRRATHAYTLQGDTLLLDGLPYLSLAPFSQRGGTFLKNAVAALALTHGYHTPESAYRALAHFQSLPYRRQLIHRERGVCYYNCSVDSSPARTAETLSTFSSPVVLLMGGRSKGTDYATLCEALMRTVRFVILCGDNAREIADAISPTDIPCEIVPSLTEAVALAKSVAREGDTVVFSPASTSFDRYKNFEERGEHFSSLVKS